MSMDTNSSTVGNMDGTVSEYSVPEADLDSAEAGKETGYINTDFQQQYGYYKDIPELNSAINAKAQWTVGKGYEADEETEQRLDKIKGWGKDTFNTILENCVRMYNIAGDSFCEIMRDGNGQVVNLKPLNPGKIKIITNDRGIIQRYEQINGEGTDNIKFKPEDIFHLAWNRVGDEIHGTSIITSIEKIIKMRNEAMQDLKKIFHRYVKPLWVWQLDTDDEDKIEKFKKKADRTVEKSENIYIPKGAAEAERMSVPQYSTLDPLPWIENLTEYFYEATNIPDVILGSAGNTTEASAKILYLAFQQSIEKNQLFIEENCKQQLDIDINLKFPASLEDKMTETERKNGNPGFQENETEANLEGKN